MKNHFEIEAFTMNVKEFQYSKGTGYNFSFGMRGEAQSEDKNSAPVVWISGVSFNQPILDKRNYLLRGKLQVKPPYRDYPAGLQLVVSEGILLEKNMYTVARKRPNAETTTKEEGYNIANGMNSPSEMQRQKFEKEQNYVDPVAKLNPASPEIPM